MVSCSRLPSVPQDVQDIGRELIRQSRALGVGERLAKRSKSLFELSDKGDWVGMRGELVKTQADVEESMMELHDEEMAHMVSLGGWLRGFQLGAVSTDERYTPAKADILGRADVMEYFLDRLDTLNPRLKATEMVTAVHRPDQKNPARCHQDSRRDAHACTSFQNA
jgi:hypothetical protein